MDTTKSSRGPEITVVIPVYNDYEELADCLRCIGEQSVGDDEFEVLVVDNGSDPDRYRDLDSEIVNLRQLHQTRLGSYAARNLGIARSSGEILAFTDADCRPEPRWLELGAAAVRNGRDIGFVGGDIDVYPEDERDPTIVEKFEMRHAFHPKTDIETENYTVTANLFAPRSVFESVGTFNGALFSGGDREWCQRVARCGYEVRFEPDAVVRHPARKHLGEWLERTERVATGWHRDESESSSVADTLQVADRFFDHLHRAVKRTGETFRDPNLRLTEKFQLSGLTYFQGLAHYLRRLRLLFE